MTSRPAVFDFDAIREGMVKKGLDGDMGGVLRKQQQEAAAIDRELHPYQRQAVEALQVGETILIDGKEYAVADLSEGSVIDSQTTPPQTPEPQRYRPTGDLAETPHHEIDLCWAQCEEFAYNAPCKLVVKGTLKRMDGDCVTKSHAIGIPVEVPDHGVALGYLIREGLKNEMFEAPYRTRFEVWRVRVL